MTPAAVVDRNAVIVRKLRAAGVNTSLAPSANGHQHANGNASPAPLPPSPSGNGNTKPKGDARDKTIRRMKTFNAFVDTVGRYVPSNAREVWQVTWRFADAVTNEAEVRVRDISTRLGCDDRKVERGLKWLRTAGLITRLRRGTRQGGPSRYFVDPDPARHLHAIQANYAESHAQKKKRATGHTARAIRSARGQFTTRHR